MIRYILLPALTTAVLAAIGMGLAHSLRRSPAVQASGDEPVELWPDDVSDILSIVMCTRCSSRPEGPCTCGIRCVHPACVFDQTDLDGFSRDDLAFLRGERDMPEKRDAL